jgi:hypothetical protein
MVVGLHRQQNVLMDEEETDVNKISNGNKKTICLITPRMQQ